MPPLLFLADHLVSLFAPVTKTESQHEDEEVDEEEEG